MGALAIISLIVSIVRAIPDFIALVNFILALIRKGDKAKMKERRQRLYEFLKEARSTHDYSKLGTRLELMKRELEKEMESEL
jgi:hypothetical protein